MGERMRTIPESQAIASALRDQLIPGLLRGKVPLVLDEPDQPESVRLETGHDRWIEDEIVAFTNVLVNCEAEDASRYFAGILEKGHSISTLFDELLTGSAHLLGKMWAHDDCSFAEVTLSMATLHSLLHRYSQRLALEIGAVPGTPLILITPIPGENHILAASMLAEYFRAAQWRVQSGIDMSRVDLIRGIESEYYDVIGITVSRADKIDDCARLVGELRSRSRNREVYILVGGPPFDLNSELYMDMGANGSAVDAMEALDVANAIWSARRAIGL